MKRTKENMVKLLNEMSSVSQGCAIVFKEDGNETMYKAGIREHCCYETFIHMLTDKDTFDDLWKIYFE